MLNHNGFVDLNRVPDDFIFHLRLFEKFKAKIFAHDATINTKQRKRWKSQFLNPYLLPCMMQSFEID